ncbi:MAG TPA: dTMP kinase [Gammaproteobacteria bacterium]|jgi:dTMP kinase
MARGAFITLEGAEGVGKSTCLGLIGGRLEARGRDVVTTREPGGTPIGEHIREWLLAGTHGRLTAETEAVLMFAARAVHVEAVIEPALASGRWVVCDRFADATFAYQGGGRGADQEFLSRLEAGVLGGLQADLTLLLDAPVDVGLARISGRPLDRFEREDRQFFERVRAAYLERARRYPQRIKVVDASRPLGEVERQLLETLDAFEAQFGDRRAG